MVDAITGLGTSDLRVEEWGLDIVIGGSQKAVMIPPGLAFASVSEKAWGLIAKSKLPRFYFDFAKERKNQAKGRRLILPPRRSSSACMRPLNTSRKLDAKI